MSNSLEETEAQEVLAIQPPLVALAVLVAVDQCDTCATLWRLFSDDTYSLVPGMTPGWCCDNVAMIVTRIWPREPTVTLAQAEGFPT
jgi:hypothetical protein